MTHHQMQTIEIFERMSQAQQGSFTSIHEGWAQQQIFGRIARQTQLGGDHQPGPLRIGLAGRLFQQTNIAGQVADGHIDLGQGNKKWGLG